VLIAKRNLARAWVSAHASGDAVAEA